jgi:proteasome lid subunit RPN8/RPN11
MTLETVKISRQLVNQLLHHAQNSPEAEVCGLVGGKEGKPTHYYPVKNSSETPSSRFLLDAEGQLEAMKAMRERGETLFAIYHSHPTSPAEPSATDLELAAYPEALYLIISLDTEGVLEMRGFRLTDSGTAEIELQL